MKWLRYFLIFKTKSKEERKELGITIGQHINNLTDNYLGRNNLYGNAYFILPPPVSL
jgi:hypothetical protein